MGSAELDTGHGAPRNGPAFATLAAIAAAVVAAALVVLVMVRLGDADSRRDATLARERHSYEVMLAARSVEASMASGEAALGRYAIGADKAMGATYYDDWVLAGAQITRLQALVSRDPDEAQLVARLAGLYARRGRELGQPAVRAAQHQGWPALTLFNAAGHSPLIGEIDDTLAAVRAHELAKLENRTGQSDAAAARAGSLVRLLSVIGLALIGAAGALALAVGVAMRRRARAEAAADEAADRAAWLREAVAERTAELSAANARLHEEMAEREAAQAQLRQMQKMEAVGQLTGGIAHDFNNMLAVVVGGLDLAKRRLDREVADVSQHLDRALDGANRAAALTRRLMGFARAEPLLPEAVEAGRLIAGMAELIDRTLGERVLVTVQVAPDCWSVFADPIQLENAILNLAVNGRDAMDGAGTLVIAAGNRPLRDGEVGALAAGDYLCLSVSDTGCGMTPEVAERVFEPFFTTKPVGKGTGLGLSTLFGFVRGSGGEVAIDTAPSRGTTVSLYLPRAEARPERLSAPVVQLAPTALPAPVAGEPVLLVEDDARVRVATAEALEAIGLVPLACSDGEEALALLGRRPDVRLMITDVVMPGLTGPELAAQARARRPELEILFVTGHAGDSATGLRGEALLRKPFTVIALERAVAAALQRASAPHPAPAAAAAG